MPATSGIIVITHSGLLPSRGGKRLGYQAGGKVFLFGGPPEGYSAPVLRSQTPKTASRIIYSSLPRAAHTDGECNACGKYPNPCNHMETDEGSRLVVKCQKCGQLMRPRY